MACGSCSGKSSTSANTPHSTKTKKIITKPEDCLYDEGILNSYINMLNTVKNNGTYAQIGLSIPKINAYLGLIQSALNYPDNYCLFEKHLDVFRSSTLPKLITNVS